MVSRHNWVHRPLTMHEQATMVFVRRCVVVGMWIVALAGGACRWPGIDTHERHPVYPSAKDKYQAVPMPPMATNKQSMVRAMAVEELPATNTIGLAWDNATNYIGTTWRTGLEASPDLKTWIEVANIPYGMGGYTEVWLSNRPATEFYRAFNRDH